MQFIIVGEDDLTRAVIKRLISVYCPGCTITREEPVRGGQIQSLMPNYNLLARNFPIFVLTDADAECPPDKIRNWFQGSPVNNNLFFRVAVDEVESWLLADRKGFAHYLGVPLKVLPQATQAGNEMEISFSLNYKSSLFLMREIVPHSKNNLIKEGLMPRNQAKKGPQYNSLMVPFVKIWDIPQAAINSSSLNRTISRLMQFYNTHSTNHT